MRALHMTYTYHPDAVGGTEVYAASLAHELRSHGWESVLCAPGARDDEYEFEGQRVRRIGIAQDISLDAAYGQGSAHAAASFARVLDDERPDIVNFHAFTAGASLGACREVQARGIPLVFTYHTPTVSCVRGDLLQWGMRPCDGRMQAGRCSACLLHSRGIPRAAARGLALMPARALSCAAGFASGRWATALRIPLLVRRRHEATRTLWAIAGRIVAVCDWVRNLLIANGVDPAKVIVSRQGVDPRLGMGNPAAARQPGPLRLVYMGRLDPTKGIDVLVDALALIPQSAVRLDIYPAGPQDSGWWKAIRSRMDKDPRICLQMALPHAEVVDVLKKYDVLAVPSRWMETGPLVVYEARAARIRILGSRLGGISELLEGATDGDLLEPDSPKAWAARIAELAADASIARGAGGTVPPRTMTQAAQEIAAVYCDLVHEGGPAR